MKLMSLFFFSLKIMQGNHNPNSKTLMNIERKTAGWESNSVLNSKVLLDDKESNPKRSWLVYNLDQSFWDISINLLNWERYFYLKGL